MVLPEVRTQLRDRILAFFSNPGSDEALKEFEDQYNRHWKNSPDLAVREIATEFCESVVPAMFPDEIGFGYRVKPREVFREFQYSMERSALFLETNKEYSWSEPPNVLWLEFFGGLFICAGIVVSLFSGLLWLVMISTLSWSLIHLGLLGLTVGSLLLSGWLGGKILKMAKKRERIWHNQGDLDSWPFLTKLQWEEARKEQRK